LRNSIICEGTTDMLLIGYVLQEKYEWKFVKHKTNDKGLIEYKDFSKGEKLLRLYVADSITKMVDKFKIIKEINEGMQDDLCFDKVIILIDNDDKDSNKKFIDKFNKHNGCYLEKVNDWFKVDYVNGNGEDNSINLNVVSIPQEEVGAMETFLLKILSENDEIDKKIIEDCYLFIDKIKSSQNKYLKKRGKIIKARFNTYFSIRLPGESYNEFTKIFKDIKWEDYKQIDKVFKCIEEL
jgi:hypothetical protein